MIFQFKKVFGGDGTLRDKIVGMYAFLAATNILLCAVAICIFRNYPLLLGTCFLAYSLGLRHAVDADHIAAIDNVTYKMMRQGKSPVGVGFFFSLGHSTIVFVLSAAVAVTAVAIKNRFNSLEKFGNIAGTLVSVCFLIAIAAMNIVFLVAIYRTFHRVKAGGVYKDEDINVLLTKRGFFGHAFRGLFQLINHSWQMYPVGLLFGLGFDTATEVSLLGISAAGASKGLPIWSIMIFPALFAAGMALVDTTDSVLMLGTYGWAFIKPMRKLYYNITITLVSVVVALIIGGLETLGLVQGQLDLSGPFWGVIALLNDNFGILGYIIIGIFVLSWGISIIFYKMKRYDDIEVTVAE